MNKEIMQQLLDALCLYLTAGHGNSTDFEKQGVAYDKAIECIAALRTAIEQPESLSPAAVQVEHEPLDANALERIAKKRPNDFFLKGSGVLKLIEGIRQLERELRNFRATIAQQVPPACQPWEPYLSDRADGVKGHYAIARWNPKGYREVWNLWSHRWASASEDVLTREKAESLLQAIVIPTAQPVQPASTEKLHKFLDAAAGEGLVLDDICAADLYIELFPAFYAAIAQPVQQQRVPLTDEAISLMARNDDDGDWNNLIYQDCWLRGYKDGARAIEAAHGIKGEQA